MPRKPPTIQADAVTRLWLHRQGFSAPRGSVALSRAALVNHLARTGALQLDSVNVVDRAHYLTLWSRFGPYDRKQLDRWVYDEGLAYEYWGHEASILPIAHLPIGLRRMRGFPPERWSESSWWQRFNASASSKRRVLGRLRKEGPLESADFERRPSEKPPLHFSAYPKEDKRALQVLWHAGRVAVRRRRHFRRVYDLAERVYPTVEPVRTTALEDSWLLIGLKGNGVASERHLVNYWTGPSPTADLRKRIIARNMKAKRVVKVDVNGLEGTFYALPEDLDLLRDAPEAHGTTLICPFDSLLWQRQRAEDLLGFRYRIEIYVPPTKRIYGYYVLPIMHNGRMVGRLDPKLHRTTAELEIKTIHIEPGFQPDAAFKTGFSSALESLATFLGASKIRTPTGWTIL